MMKKYKRSFPSRNRSVAAFALVVLTISLISAGCGLLGLGDDDAFFNHEAGPILFLLSVPGGDGHRELFSMNADGTGIRQLTDDENSPVLSAAWSPDRQSIAFSVENNEQGLNLGFGELFIVDKRGAIRKRISKPGSPGLFESDFDATWSHSGESLAFRKGSGCCSFSGVIPYTTIIYGTEHRPLGGRMKYSHPERLTWALEDQVLISTARHTVTDGAEQVERFFIGRWSLEGDSLSSISSPGSHFKSPALSRDGTTLAFQEQSNGITYVHLSDANFENRRTIQTGSYTNVKPIAWSPDDTRILSTGIVDGVSKIIIIHLDGRGIDDVTPFPGVVSQPHSWR